MYKENLMTGSIPLAEGRVELPSWTTAARRARRAVERWVRRLPLPEFVRAPARRLRRNRQGKRFE
jgi:hypothetical protein